MGDKYLIYQLDDLKVEPGDFRVSKGGLDIQIEPKAFRVLVYLIENRGRLVEKQELLDTVWKDTFVSENAMTRSIAQLRKALGDNVKVPKYIETVPTKGYRFVAEVEVINGNLQTNDEVLDQSVEQADSPRPGLTNIGSLPSAQEVVRNNGKTYGGPKIGPGFFWLALLLLSVF